MTDSGSEYGRLMAERDRLVADGIDPADLDIPIPPPATPTTPAEERLAALLQQIGIADLSYIAIAQELLASGVTLDADEGLLAAAVAAYDVLTRLAAQAADGGGARGEVYVTVQTWRLVIAPVIEQLRVALASKGAAASEGGTET